MRTSNGAEQRLRVFLVVNRVEESDPWVTSARRPNAKEAVARVRPMMVRYCQCQPYESLIGVGKSTRYLYDAAKLASPTMCKSADALPGELSLWSGFLIFCSSCEVIFGAMNQRATTNIFTSIEAGKGLYVRERNRRMYTAMPLINVLADVKPQPRVGATVPGMCAYDVLSTLR